MVAMCADSAVGSRSSAPSAASARTVACWAAPHSRNSSKSCRAARSTQIGGEDRGTVELAGFDAHPALHEERVGVHEWAPREAELGGPACRARQLGLGAGEIAVHEAGQGQVHVRDRLVGLEPHRVNVVVACWRPGRSWPPRGRKRRHRSRRAATPRPRTGPRSPGGTTAGPSRGPRAATRAPGPPGAGRHARSSSSPAAANVANSSSSRRSVPPSCRHRSKSAAASRL